MRLLGGSNGFEKRQERKVPRGCGDGGGKKALSSIFAAHAGCQGKRSPWSLATTGKKRQRREEAGH